jgi:hypothetical protein
MNGMLSVTTKNQPMPNLSKYKRAAIVGMYRNGSAIERICVDTGISFEKVKTIIEAYFKIKL